MSSQVARDYRSAGLACIYLSVVISTMAQVTPTPAPTINGKIAFMSDRTAGNYWDTEIDTIDPDGSNQISLSGVQRRELRGDFNPAWSPDGTKIAFSGWRLPNQWTQHIYVMNADGSNKICLTGDPIWTPHYDVVYYSYPAWSPDGKRIAFSGAHGDRAGIFVINADGSNLVLITNAFDTAPAWSPDGTRIAFTHHLPDSSAAQIHVMDADGANQIRLTDTHYRDESPAWSPDGSKIAFDSNRSGNGYRIYVMNADGSNPVELTHIVGTDTRPEWSPDGTKIAFTSNRVGFNAIYTMNPDGSDQTALTRNLMFVESGPRWQRLQAHPDPRPASASELE